MLVKTSEISAWRAFIIPFLFDLQHISLKISASVLMIWDQTEDTGLPFRRDTAFCLAQNGTKNRPAKTQNCLKVGIVQEFCLPALPLDCYKGGVLWCFEMNDPKYNMRSSYKKHTNDLKWSQSIAKNQPSKSWKLQLSCCILIHQPPEKPLGCLPDPSGGTRHLSTARHLNLTLGFRSTTIGESVWRIVEKISKARQKGHVVPLFFIINDDSHGNYPSFFSWKEIDIILADVFCFSLEIRKTSFILFETNLPIFWIPSSLGFLSERRNSTRSIRLQWCANLECQRLPRSRFRR